MPRKQANDVSTTVAEPVGGSTVAAARPIMASIKSPPQDIAEVWRVYARDHGERARNILIENYLPVVRYVADRIHKKLPSEVDVNDLVSAGVFGLMAAIEAFDPARGVKFETYGATRVHGAILDELRSWDWVPRLARSRSHKLHNVTRELESELGRAPTHEEAAARLGVGASDFAKMARDSNAISVISLSRKKAGGDGENDLSEIDVLEDRRSLDPLREAHRKDLRDVITRGLSRAERLIVLLYYFEQMTMKEIGATLDLSESRVSQMHTLILGRLKAQMSHRQAELRQTAAA